MKYLKGYGNLSFVSVKREKGLTDQFMAVKMLRKRFAFFFYNSYLKDSVFTAVKRDTTFLTGYVNGLPLILSVDGILKGYLFCQKWYVKGG